MQGIVTAVYIYRGYISLGRPSLYTSWTLLEWQITFLVIIKSITTICQIVFKMSHLLSTCNIFDRITSGYRYTCCRSSVYENRRYNCKTESSVLSSLLSCCKLQWEKIHKTDSSCGSYIQPSVQIKYHHIAKNWCIIRIRCPIRAIVTNI